MEDTPARIIGIIGIAIGLAGLLLTAFLWRRAGPRMQVTAFVRAETGAIHVEVASTGRIPVTVRQVEIRDHFTMTMSQGGRTDPTSRWVFRSRRAESPRL
jgi:hypothetical protein